MNTLDYDTYHEKAKNREDSYLNVEEDWIEIKNYLQEYVHKDARILELGSGGGYFGNWLRKNNYKNIVCSDNSQISIEEGGKRFPELEYLQLNAQEFHVKNFDIVISLDLIEHLPDIQKHLKCVHEALNNGGKYIIKTPNKTLENIYYSKILLRKDKEKKHPWWTAHISLQSKNSLRKSLSKEGFSTIFLRQKKLTIAQEKKVRLIISKPLHAPAISTISFLLKIIPKSAAVQLIAVAKKNS